MTTWLRMRVKRLKRTGARTHPCFTPLVVLNGSDVCPPECTSTVMSSWNRWIRFTNFFGHPSFDRITQSASLLTCQMLGQVCEGSMQIHFLLSAFLVDLLDRDHVNCAAIDRREMPAIYTISFVA